VARASCDEVQPLTSDADVRPVILITLLLITTIGIHMAAAIAQDTAKPFPPSANTVQNLSAKAEKGDASAQWVLGTLYGSGAGVPQNYTEAVKWVRKAADQGNAFAQGDLGVYYHNGQGVPQDYVEAVKWWHRAAEQGIPDSQAKLGAAYALGQGVPQDYEEAYAWLSLAAAQGNNDATKLRDDAATKLTPDALLRAQQLSKQYFAAYAKHPSGAAP